MKKSVKISETRFWELVKATGWSRYFKRVNNIEVCTERLRKVITPEEIEPFYNMIHEKADALSNRIYSWSKKESGGKHELLVPDKWFKNGKCYISEDSWGDGCSHIVGLGQEQYDAVMNNPYSFYDHFKTQVDMALTERFSYVALDLIEK